jgi:hypothetical protein
VEIPEILYSVSPSQELSQAALGRKKSPTPISKFTVHCRVRSKWYDVRNDNSPVKVLAGVPTDILPNHSKSDSESNSMSASPDVSWEQRGVGCQCSAGRLGNRDEFF